MFCRFVCLIFAVIVLSQEISAQIKGTLADCNRPRKASGQLLRVVRGGILLRVKDDYIPFVRIDPKRH